MILYLTPLILITLYFIYTRLVAFYLKKWYYERQGVQVPKGLVPVFGHLPRFKQLMDKYAPETSEAPWALCLREDFGNNVPKIVAMYNSYTPILYVSDPDAVNDLFVVKNKYFDKHPGFKNMLYPLLGDTFSLLPSDESWKNKRKSLSAVFYKERLGQMLSIMIETVSKALLQWKTDFAENGKEFNLIKELDLLLAKNIMACIFGEDITEKKIKIVKDGQIVEMDAVDALNHCFIGCFTRQLSL